jgi:hypothetical protein
MALSPNYGWAEPDNSSLVKNGAQDIRALGDAIDTSLWNVGYGQAGKNKLINGDFRINQRNFTSVTTNGAFSFDRWVQSFSGGTVTVTPQTFTAGAAPVASYEGINFARIDVTGQSATNNYAFYAQKIEDVRTFANQTVTVSFWAKAGSGTPKVSIEADQQFGSGGSARVTTYGGQITLSTSWARYSVSFAIPSISGKTIGTSSFLGLNLWTSAGSDFNSRTGSLGIQTATIDFWGVQAEYGSKATPFQTASGSIAGELILAQRYYYRNTAAAQYNVYYSGAARSTTLTYGWVQYPVEMRIAPTAVDYSNVAVWDYPENAFTISALTLVQNSKYTGFVAATTTGLTASRPYYLLANTSSSYIGFSAEL